MKILIAILAMTIAVSAQKAAPHTAANPSAFPETSVSINLAPINLPGLKTSVAGVETDVMIAPSEYLSLGETTIVSPSMVFTGGRYNYQVEAVSSWIQNHSPNLNGYQFQFYLTGSAGVVKPVGSTGTGHWGERAGIGLNYAISGTWGTAFEAQWGNFPGVAHTTWTLAFGPNVHF